MEILGCVQCLFSLTQVLAIAGACAAPIACCYKELFKRNKKDIKNDSDD